MSDLRETTHKNSRNTTAHVALPQVHLRINGEKVLPRSGESWDHVNPVTGEVDATVPLADAAGVDDAVRHAHTAFDGWRRTAPARRRELLLKLADLIDRHSDEIVRLGAAENGRPARSGSGLAALAAEWTRYYAGWADKIIGEVTGSPQQDGELGYTLPQPYGVVALVVTWNAPLMSIAMKAPAALAAGNTVVIKPSELTPFTGELFMDLVEEAGFPPGVVNVLPGTADAGNRLVTHPLVRKVSFTGGLPTATKILTACAETAKPVVLELGGKSANIVLEDADLDAACAFNMGAAFGGLAGQGCGLPTRMLVHESIHDEVVARIRTLVDAIQAGDPTDPATGYGPVVSQSAMDRIMGMIERAVADGATLVAGGGRMDRPGYYIEPTVLTDVDPSSEIAQIEVFGPVVAITTFSTDEEAITIANSTRYGLSSYIQTKNLTRAHRIAAELEAGEVLINGAPNLAVHRPFGGIGISGGGKEGGRAGFEEFLRVKSVAITIR
ncbi:aldehyde dehydrogenase family protein [Streptomyces phaeochromogenes]|uniref:aldehyde dehydrogenase family protein n=1 Tax=Streptomyces phaeochromogenes TaxID=1923 RepID=UPI0033C95C25